MAIPMTDLKFALTDSITSALAGLLEGAEHDMQAFGVAIADDLAQAAAVGDHARIEELADQAQALAEIQRLRAVNEGWAIVRTVVRTAGMTALGILRAAGGLGFVGVTA